MLFDGRNVPKGQKKGGGVNRHSDFGTQYHTSLQSSLADSKAVAGACERPCSTAMILRKVFTLYTPLNTYGFALLKQNKLFVRVHPTKPTVGIYTIGVVVRLIGSNSVDPYNILVLPHTIIRRSRGVKLDNNAAHNSRWFSRPELI